MVGGLRERDYQLAAQKRNEACRRFDNNCQTARYFERESRLAKHFNSWSSRDNYSDKNKFYNDKSKADKLERRKNNLKKMLRDEETDYKNEMKNVEASRDGRNEKNREEESVEELKRKLDAKRAERALYYPNNYRCYESCLGVRDSVTSCPRHYANECHIDACRNSQVSMEDTNLRNYSSDCQGRRENPENRHHGEKRHLQGHTMYGTNIDSFGDFSNRPNKNTGERRHYDAVHDNVEEGTNAHPDRDEADNVTAIMSKTRFRDEQDRSSVMSGHAAVSERRHYYTQSSSDSFRSLANTNMREVSVGKPAEVVEQEEEEAEAEEEIREPEAEEAEEPEAEVETRKEVEENEVWEQTYDVADESRLSRSESGGWDNKKNWSTDNLNFSWKYDDPAKRPVCFLTHNELINQIQDLVNREHQACKKQNWSEALRLRDMRNRLELQREIEIFNQSDLDMNNETRRSEMRKLSDRMKLIEKREAGGNQHLIYSEEARNLWDARVREDESILSEADRAQREILLKELEEEWEAMTLQDKHRVAESPSKLNKSHLQEELELTAAAMEKVEQIPEHHASNEDSKNSCTRNKDKAASSFILG